MHISYLINLWFVFDIFGTVGVSEGGQGLVVVVVGWGEARNHHGLRVPAQGILYQSVL